MQDRIKQQIQAELTKTLEGAYMDALDRSHNVISGNGIEARIKQMAVEAGFSVASADDVTYDPYATSEVLLARFARLVAEDCARWVDGNAAQCSGITAELMHSNADAIRARYAETKEVKR